ncbi:hypothetical protein Goklo_029469 [Gossypium klotzschianum]|uniref:DUF7745 domain-containing protein n=1 Tax=Gossypium klotzschianum TaxID=34286 RepID=A0A7J8WA42_9ROSI|nr:hypothetical protein [Gossypium klotzschianum]
MEKGFLDKVEDNTIVQTWSEATQHEKGDTLTERYVSKLWYFNHISVTQNSLQDLKEIWDQWNDEVDKRLFQALAQFWNTAYSCFTFGKVDLVLTVEEYLALLRCLKIQVDRAHSRAVSVPTFLKKLMNITRMSEQYEEDVFALSIYGLVVFPKALGHVDEVFSDLFDQLNNRVTPVPTILVETFRSLNAYRRAGEEKDVEWRAPWLLSDEILYRCSDFDWVPLLGIWGAIGYAPLLVLRQYRSR